jgi:hypothetical protein
LKTNNTLWILLIAVVLIIGGCYLGLSYKNQSQQQAALRQQIVLANRKTSSVPIQDLKNRENSLKTQALSLVSQISDAKISLTRPIDYTSAVKSVYGIAGDSRVTVEAVSSGDITSQNQENIAFQSLPLTLKISGQIPDIDRFIQELTDHFSTSIVKPIELSVVTETKPVAPYTWGTELNSPLPNWANLDPGTGAITGTPDKPGIYYFTVDLTDNQGHLNTRVISIRVNPVADLLINKITLPDATATFSYEQTLDVSGGQDLSSLTNPYTWSLENSKLPAWASLDTSTGKITGTPGVDDIGTTIFTAKVVDVNGNATTQNLALTVDPYSPLTIQHGSLPDALVGFPYKQTLTVSGRPEQPETIEYTTATATVDVSILTYEGK